MRRVCLPVAVRPCGVYTPAMNVRLFMLSLIAFGLGFAAAGSRAQNRPRPQRAPIPDDAPPLPENTTECNYQTPVDFLVRENFLPRWTQPPEEQRRRRGLQAQAVEWRTQHYGYFEGFGNRRDNENTPMENSSRVEFMDLSVRLNNQIHPALACVEQQIRAECGDDDYTPVRLSGLRTRNTYHNGQVSNHVYGIAIDIDPQLNTCCMCVAQWGDHPLCQNPVESIYERMAMPPCWVHVFERFGFYWLGRDRLQDTMHFEFLGDPAHILKSAGPAPHMAAQAGEGSAVETGETGEAETEATETDATETGEAADSEAVEPAATEGDSEAATETAEPATEETQTPATAEEESATEEAATEETTEAPEEESAPESSGCSVAFPGL